MSCDNMSQARDPRAHPPPPPPTEPATNQQRRCDYRSHHNAPRRNARYAASLHTSRRSPLRVTRHVARHTALRYASLRSAQRSFASQSLSNHLCWSLRSRMSWKQDIRASFSPAAEAAEGSLSF